MAVILMLVVGYNLGKNKITSSINKSKAISILIFSGLFLVIGYYFFFMALKNTKTLTLVVLIAYIMPIIITAIISCLYLNEKFNLGMISGVIISIIGITLFIINCKK